MLNSIPIPHIETVGWRGKIKEKIPPQKISPQTKGVIFLFFVFLISGVCLVTSSSSRPIFASEIAYLTPSTQEAVPNLPSTQNIKEEAQKAISSSVADEFRAETVHWENKMKKKYGASKISFVTKGVAHIRLTKYIQGKPVKVNVVEINPKINKNLIIKPQIAGTKLNSKAQIGKIAQKENAIVAVNAGYFKPQTGVPLGALMVDGEVLTGPVYNRAGIGISQNEDGTSFSIGRTAINAFVSNETMSLKVDNINQPRMLSTYVLAYTPDWGTMVPIAPKYGLNAVIRRGYAPEFTLSAVQVPANGFVISGPKEKVIKLTGEKALALDVKPSENFKNSNHIISGGPYLIKNGEIFIDFKEEKLLAITGYNPRSAVGYNNDGEFMIVTVDGREKASVGMTLGQLAKLMRALGCQNAINLDGGGSSVIYVKGRVANSPAQKGGIPISNALVVSEK